MTETRPAIDTLRDIRHGEMVDELDHELHYLVAQCVATGKVGTLTLSIKIKPDQSSGAVFVEDELKVNEPKLPKSTLFHVTPENNLSLRDQRQTDIEGLRDVNIDKPAPRDVDGSAPQAAEV